MPETEKPGKELESWKEIAAYLGTSVRTVQRWEEQNGLPVRRVMREKRAAIYADTAELDRWLESRTVGGGRPEAEEEPKATTPSKWSSRWAGGVVMLAVLAGGVAWVGRRPEAGPELQARRVTSEPGFEAQPAASPDGEWIAYIRLHQGRGAIGVRRVEGGETVWVGEGTEQLYSPQWSRDGRWIGYLRRTGVGISELMVYDWKSRTGPVKMGEAMGTDWFSTVVHAYPALQWAPDGKGVLLVDRGGTAAGYRIVLLDLATQRRTELMEAPKGMSVHGFALSPEARRLAVVMRGESYFRVHVGNLDANLRLTGELRAVMTDGVSTESPGWMPGGDLLFIRGQKELWRMRDGEEPRRVTVTGMWPDYSVSGAAGDRVFWSHVEMDTAVWLYDRKRQELVRPLCDSTTMERRARISPDGREMLFNSERDGYLNIWACDLETETVRPISRVKGAAVWAAEWSPDGKRIAFTVNEGERGELRVVQRDGSGATTLSAGQGQWANPMWSGNGKRIHYVLTGKGKPEVRSVGVAGGDERREGELPGPATVALRRDGRYWMLGDGKLWLASAELAPGEIVTESVAELGMLLPDGLGISYTRRINTNVSGNYEFYERMDGGEERKVAGVAKEGMGYNEGPPGYLFAILNSDANSDLYVGGPLL